MKSVLIAIALSIWFWFVSDTLAAPMSIAFPTATDQTIQRDTVRNMYTMRTRYWNDGSRIVVINLPADSQIHKQFVRSVLNMSPISYQQGVDRMRNAGLSGSFVEVDNEKDMLTKVSVIYGAIGYVSDDTLVIYSGGAVRALRIID